MFKILRHLFLFLFIALTAVACDDDHNHDHDEEGHTDAEGFALENDGTVVYRQFEGEVTVDNLILSVNETLDLSVHFLDHDGDEIEIRLFSQEFGQELRVMADLNVDTYGESPITIGSIHVLNEFAVPAEFGLEQNYPNPFNPTTTIDVSVATDSHILLNIYDINGRLVLTLADDNYDTGYHSFMWNGLDQYGNKASAGIYFYSLHTKEMTLTKKMILMK